MADTKKTIEELVDKIKGDPALLKNFTADPVKTLKGMTGVDLPDGSLETVAAGIKAKLAVGGVADKLGKLF